MPGTINIYVTTTEEMVVIVSLLAAEKKTAEVNRSAGGWVIKVNV